MEKRIIYQTDDGGVAVIIPAPEAVNLYGLEAIAQKDVPAGKPYKIIDVADVPTDRTFRAAWEVDPATLTDGVGTEVTSFQPVEIVAPDMTEVLIRMLQAAADGTLQSVELPQEPQA